MHTEHIRNLHPGWVVGGWLLSVAVTAVAFMVLVGLGLLGPDEAGTALLVPACVAVGFFAGGLFVGLRWSDAPILHGAAITFLSVLVWFVSELVTPVLTARFESLGTRPSFVLGMILLQLLFAVAGAWTGRSLIRRGESPHLPG